MHENKQFKKQSRAFDTNPYLNTQITDPNLGLNNPNPYINTQNNIAEVNNTTNPLLGTFDTQKFLIGALIGAAGVYLMTNEKAQKAMFKTFAKGSAMITAGIEEMKERYEDAQAELEAEQNA